MPASSLHWPVAQGKSGNGLQGSPRRTRGRRDMRHKLALTIALASFGVVTALGVSFAEAESVSQGSAIGGPATIVPATASLECSNSIDDDADGLLDGEDPGCAESEGSSEDPPAPGENPEAGGEIEGPAQAPPPAGGLHAGGSIGPGGNVH